MVTLRVKPMTDFTKDSCFLGTQSLSLKLMLLVEIGTLCVILQLFH